MIQTLFGKLANLLFSNKHSLGEPKIALTEKGVIMTKSNKVDKLCNSYFASVKNLLTFLTCLTYPVMLLIKYRKLLIAFQTILVFLKLCKIF